MRRWIVPQVEAVRPVGKSVGVARATGDFNGDGRPDIMSLVGTALVLQLQQPGGTFLVSATGFGMSQWHEPFVVDANQDGRLDVVLLATQTTSAGTGFLLTAVLPHAVPQVWPIGIGTPGCRGHIPLSANADPTAGLATFGITATNTPTSAPGILLASSQSGFPQFPIPEQWFNLGFTLHGCS